MKTELELKTGEVLVEGSPENIREIVKVLIEKDLLEPEYRFNGGRGALLCSLCKVILKENISVNECSPVICKEDDICEIVDEEYLARRRFGARVDDPRDFPVETDAARTLSSEERIAGMQRLSRRLYDMQLKKSEK